MAKTIADNLQTIIDIKQNIKTAIKNKGVEVADSDSFTTYADKIESIETGGGDTTNYSYLVNTVDEAGLRAIGWSDESIGYFKDNTLHYQWENSDYVVSEENKVLYGKINKNNIGTYVDNPNVIFMPMFDINGIPTYVNALRDFKHIKGVPILDLANATVINYFFSSCSALITIPLLNTSNVNSMNSMFSNCTKLESIPQLNTSKVTDMRNMFHYCTSLATIPLLNTSKVTNMQSMFNGCTNLKTIPPLNTSKVTHMSYMFNGCSNLTTIPQLDTSNVTNMDIIFGNCTKLKSIPPLRADNIVVLNYLFNDAKMTALTDFGGLINLKAKSTGVYGFQRCPNLSYQSCINILNGLYDFTGNGETPDSFQGQLKVHSNFLSLVGDEISIGTNKGWTITA